MSEINCNKLEITSLRQCDSIKNRENIGPCIIEGPARQDSCQSCQPGCSYWIWPVTHTQISPVKITGYIDFLFLFVSACEREDAALCASISSTSLEKCGRSYVCVQVSVCCMQLCSNMHVPQGSKSGAYTSGASNSASEAARCVCVDWGCGKLQGTHRPH